ncbi:MAG: MBL fold metallo-hydrolase [Nitrosopumilus sp.]|uniref:ComEC/Rec2 family competence protein n=1 Tax=Nitrosopumilus sp. TaxID=2024843 RepID=UPI0024310294|nr:MBL fold metallo-hydrolase [Nitrosopumilus sp.]MCV0367238.1 MBL fold metallo-hydrolase [Nitrosopumilus sp.]
MTNLLVSVWNVEHGSSVYAVTPNGRKVFLDCGSSSEFSPAKEVNSTYEKKKLDYLVITHPHRDHITDLEFVEEKFNIKVIRRNKKITKDVMLKDNPDVFDPPNDKIIERYFKLSDRFTKNVEPDEDPSNPSWGNGCTFHSFNNDDKELGVNNLSVATFIEFGSETILQGGDLEEKGWLELLKDKEFREHLKKTTILLASHHGNDSGYCKELFDYFTPKITIFSAGSYVDDNSRKKYEAHTKGITVRSLSRGNEDRWVLTTRKDGHIKIVAYPDTSMEPKITID